MTTESRRCRRCGIAIPAGMLACRYHWYVLPRRLREDILASWRDGNREAYVGFVHKADQVWKADGSDPRAAAT
jgi:hypothetical protein